MIGKKLTIFSNELHCFEVRIEITDQCRISKYYIYREKGGKDRFVLDFLTKDVLVFEGWRIPFHTGFTNKNNWRKLGEIHLIGIPSYVKHYIEKFNINPAFDKNSLSNIFHIKFHPVSGDITKTNLFPNK